MHYRNAPIQEAVFDIAVSGVKNLDVQSYEKIGNQHFLDYPTVERTISNVVHLNQKAQGVRSASGVRGLIFTHNSGNKKIQIRKDGFTFNMLKPYSNWETFSREAFLHWEVYNQNVMPLVVKRLALRYVNNIVLPLENGKVDFDEFSTLVPKVPRNLPQKLNGFFSQVQSPCDDQNKMFATISQTFRRPEENTIYYILDIEISKIIEGVADLNIFNDFEIMRSFKNEIFENAITDKTRNLFL